MKHLQVNVIIWLRCPLLNLIILFSQFLLLLDIPARSSVLIVGEHVQQVVADEVGVVVVPGEVQNALIAKSIFAGGVAHKVRFFFGLKIETRIVLIYKSIWRQPQKAMLHDLCEFCQHCLIVRTRKLLKGVQWETVWMVMTSQHTRLWNKCYCNYAVDFGTRQC